MVYLVIGSVVHDVQPQAGTVECGEDPADGIPISVSEWMDSYIGSTTRCQPCRRAKLERHGIDAEALEISRAQKVHQAKRRNSANTTVAVAAWLVGMILGFAGWFVLDALIGVLGDGSLNVVPLPWQVNAAGFALLAAWGFLEVTEEWRARFKR